MPKAQAVQKPYVSFIGGLWTEASPLSHPENTSQVEQNFRLNPDGSRERRLGLLKSDDIEHDLADNHVVHNYRWENVSNTNGSVVVALQAGSMIHLYREDEDCKSTYTLEFSYDLEDCRVNPKDIPCTPVDFASGDSKLFIAHQATQPHYVKYTSDSDCSDEPEGWSVHKINLYERDFDGVDDGLGADENPTTLSNLHRYNLLNQGWTDEYIQKYFDEAGTYPSNNESWHLGLYVDPNTGIEEWSVAELKKSSIGTANTPRGHFIRNVFDTCDFFETLDNDITDSTTLTDCDTITIRYSAPHSFTGDGTETITLVGSTIAHTYLDTSVVPAVTATEFFDVDGTYTIGTDVIIVDAYTVSFTFDDVIDSPNFPDSGGCNLSASPDLVTVGLGSNVPLDVCCTDACRPEAVGVYAGRVWWGGISSDRLGNRIYFSQILRTDNQLSRYYQQYDPTAEDFNELLQTDGGFIDLPEIGWVRSLRVLKDSLLVFADNGIWAISGGDYQYFAATSYSVSKLTEVGVIAKKSIEEIEDTWVYAANRGIYIISSENRVQNITEEAIHDRYRRIPQSRKEEIDINYNPYDKTLHVLHGLEFEQEKWRYCAELIINHRIKAWYEYKYQEHDRLTNLFTTGNDTSKEYDLVYMAEFDNLNQSHFMSGCRYEDWEGTDQAVDAPAYMLTGPELLGDLSHDKEVYDLYVFMKAEPEAGGLFRGRWDWACDDCSGDFTETAQIFKPKPPCNDMYPHKVSTCKIRNISGHGRAFEIEYSSEPLKPLRLYGWNVAYVGRARS